MKTAKQFDESMWAAYAGADQLVDGQDPYYRQIKGWLVIADGNGLTAVDLNEEEPNGDEYMLEMKLTAPLAQALLNGLPKDFTPAAYGLALI